MSKKNTVIFSFDALFNPNDIAKSIEYDVNSAIIKDYNGFVIRPELDKLIKTAKPNTFRNLQISNDALNFIYYLYDLDFIIAIASMTDKSTIDILSNHNQNLKELFQYYVDFTITKEDVKTMPEQNSYIRALATLEVISKSKENCIVVVSLIEEAKKAAEAGFDVILLSDIIDSQLPNIQVVSNFNELLLQFHG